MACACQNKKEAAKKYTVKYPSGKTYKVYGNEIEAKAAAKRVGGTVS